MKLRVFRVGVIFAITASSAPVYCMQWYEAYGRGSEKAEKGNCAEAVPLLLDAVKKEPNDDLHARPYGTMTMEYIPHYYLAKCALADGDLKAAEQYIKQAEIGGVASSKKGSSFSALKKEYQDKLRAQNTTPPVNPNPTNPGPVNPIPPVDQDALKRQQEEQARQAEIRKGVSDAQSALNAGRLQEARNAANRVLGLDPSNAAAQQILNDVSDRESSAIQQAKQERQDKINQVRLAISNNDLASAEKLAQNLSQQYPSDREVARLIDDIQKNKSAQQSQNQEAEKARSIEKQVIAAYFSGQYQAVVDLVNINAAKYQSSWRLPFYQGCAYAALSILEEKDREDREKRAKEAFRRAKGIDRNIPQNPYISPKVWELFVSS